MNDTGNWNSSLSTSKGHGVQGNAEIYSVQVVRPERSQLNDFTASPGFIQFKNTIIHPSPAAGTHLADKIFNAGFRICFWWIIKSNYVSLFHISSGILGRKDTAKGWCDDTIKVDLPIVVEGLLFGNDWCKARGGDGDIGKIRFFPKYISIPIFQNQLLGIYIFQHVSKINNRVLSFINNDVETVSHSPSVKYKNNKFNL